MLMSGRIRPLPTGAITSTTLQSSGRLRRSQYRRAVVPGGARHAPRRSNRAAYPASILVFAPVTPIASRSSSLPADRDARLGSQSVPRDAIFLFGHQRTDTISQPAAAHQRSLDNARHRAQWSAASYDDLGAALDIGDVGSQLNGFLQR